MTSAELHALLDEKDRKLTPRVLKDLCGSLLETSMELYERTLDAPQTKEDDSFYWRMLGFYSGEQNAFQVALNLINRLEA